MSLGAVLAARHLHCCMTQLSSKVNKTMPAKAFLRYRAARSSHDSPLQCKTGPHVSVAAGAPRVLKMLTSSSVPAPISETNGTRVSKMLSKAPIGRVYSAPVGAGGAIASERQNVRCAAAEWYEHGWQAASLVRSDKSATPSWSGGRVAGSGTSTFLGAPFKVHEMQPR